VELRRLRYFVAVAEHRNFTRAAAALYISQPTLSQQIRQLERTLAVTLFERDTQRVSLTPAGRELLDRAPAILSAVEDAEAATRAAAGRIDGRLRVGLALDACHAAADPLARFRRQHPDVDVEVCLGVDNVLLSALQRGEFEAVLIWMGSPTASHSCVSVAREPLVAVAPLDERASADCTAGMAGLRGEPLILFDPELAPTCYEALVRHAVGKDARDVSALHAPVIDSGQEAMLEMARRGQGWTVVTQRIFSLRPRPGLAARPVPGAASLDLIYDPNVGPAVRALAATLQAPDPASRTQETDGAVTSCSS